MKIFYFSFVSSRDVMNLPQILYTLITKFLYFLNLKLRSSHSCDSNRHLREGILLLSLITLTGYWLNEVLERFLIRTAINSTESRMFDCGKVTIKGKLGR